jgi:hypothetical protein
MISTTELFNDDCAFAAEQLQRAGELAPMFSIHFKHQGELGTAVVPADFYDQDSKDRSVMVVRIIGVAMDAFAITLMTEAWVATVSDKTDEAIANLAPSDRMDRREVLMVTMSERDAKPRASVREILRSGDGAISGLGDVEPNYGGLEGRMTGLLLPHPTAQQRAQARKMMEILGVNLESLTKPN